MPGLKATPKDGGHLISVKVAPRASREKVNGLLDGAVKIMLTAPPVEGAANQALLKFLAKKLCLTRSELAITAGQTSRLKTIWVGGGLAPDQISQRLGL